MPSLVEHFFATLALPVHIVANGDVEIPSSQPLPSMLAQNTISALPHWSVIQVTGPDAAKFLQGQLTCDIAAATTTHATPGAHCTPKGRMLSSYLIAQPAAGIYWLRVRHDIAVSATAALAKYIVFSKAKIAAQEQLLAIGLHGPDVMRAVAELAGAAPTAQWGVVQIDGGLIVQLDETGQRFEAWLPETEAIRWWQSCPTFLPVDSAFWRWLDIRAGSAAIETATVDAFIPQMLNLHLNGGVSFTKGCYTGQEIVARTQYRGQIKRHLLRAEVAAPAPMAGVDIVTADGRSLGRVAAAVDRGDGCAELLVVVSGDETAPPEMFVKNAGAAGGSTPLRVL